MIGNERLRIAAPRGYPGLRIKRPSVLNPKSQIPNPKSFSGFTLLEVILAIAVLAITLAAVGEVMRMAYQSADSAAVESEAQILAESILGELASGIRPAQAVEAAPLELLGDGREQWQYSILIEPTAQAEILQVRVVVEAVRQNRERPPRVELVQWFLNPELLPDATNMATGATTNTTTSGAGSATGSGQ